MPSDQLFGPRLLQPLPSKLTANTISVLWFRNDLRLIDNEALTLSSKASIMAAVFVFDMTERYGPTSRSPHGF